MTSGAWGTMVIEYDATYEIKSRKYPFYVREFTPLQYTRLDLDDYIIQRPFFTEDEWLDLLVQSIGFNPARFDRRVKLLMLLRLVPFVEANFNLIELGPRETGKTYTFRNTSNRSFVVSGGKATPATLFYNKATRKLGVIGLKQVVFFDEIASTRFDDAEASVSVLKDYMQTGKFSEVTRNSRPSVLSCSAGTSTPMWSSVSQSRTIDICSRYFPTSCKMRRFWTVSTPISQAGKCRGFVRRTTPPATDSSRIIWPKSSPSCGGAISRHTLLPGWT